MSRLRGCFLLVGVAALASACADLKNPAAPTGVAASSISDATHGGTPGFFWLPPMVKNPGSAGTLDTNLDPTVTICAWSGTACTSAVAEYTRAGGTGGEAVKVSDSHYHVGWHTRQFTLDAAQVYRIRVSVGARELGHADVRVVATAAAARGVDGSQYVAVVNGQTLAVKFRIEAGIPGAITVTPGTATVQPGETQQYTAVVTDLHGNVIAGAPITWSSSIASVGTVDANGLATGDQAGFTTITAASGSLTGTAALIVDQPIHRWTLMDTAHDQGNWAVWGTSASNVYVANWTSILHFDGTRWHNVDTVQWHGTLDIWGTGEDNIYAVGQTGRILHWNGTAWYYERFDGNIVYAQALGDWSNPPANIYLWGVWAAAPDDWFIVGDQGTVLRGSHGNWTKMSTPVNTLLRRVWGTSANDVYATGDNGVLLHFDGTSWSQVTLPGAPGDLFGVWGSSSNDVFVAGTVGRVYRFDGSAWTVTQLPTQNQLFGVWGTSSANVFVGGQGGVIYRWNGARWIFEEAPAQQVFDFWGPTDTDVFAALSGWQILRR
ncbi:MAG TPA: Ig-like domain-containing protein [Longimicrobium sp.]|jgi:hypothetical protein|uniref:Ig-like domain-containing protein n=1 Tax=Longimicrobium sp. TaxID=2029185 RepID=UPI002ED880A1